MSALLLIAAALGLVLGAALMAWPVAARKAVGTSPAAYRRRILGAMIVGASLFLGGFTLAVRNPIS